MNVLEHIGNTPLAEVDGIHVKLEHLNPSGSVKDRIAKYIVEKAEDSGLLKKGYTIIEATSGNTGIAFSMISALRGYNMIAVMPKGMSEERTKTIKRYGAKIISVKHSCFTCAMKRAFQLGRKPKTYLPRQFDNQWNVEENELFLGQEIIRQMHVLGVKPGAFVAGVGTGGTVIGVGKALKKAFPDVKIFALEPDECPMLANSSISEVYGKVNRHTCKAHKIEGIGDGIIPSIIRHNARIIDGIIEIKSKDAVSMADKLAKRGYFVGPSSGANLLGALKLKKKFKNVVTLFPDSGDRYLSEVK